MTRQRARRGNSFLLLNDSVALGAIHKKGKHVTCGHLRTSWATPRVSYIHAHFPLQVTATVGHRQVQQQRYFKGFLHLCLCLCFSLRCSSRPGVANCCLRAPDHQERGNDDCVSSYCTVVRSILLCKEHRLPRDLDDGKARVHTVYTSKAPRQEFGPKRRTRHYRV